MALYFESHKISAFNSMSIIVLHFHVQLFSHDFIKIFVGYLNFRVAFLRVRYALKKFRSVRRLN
jgi:hypothetical protein